MGLGDFVKGAIKTVGGFLTGGVAAPLISAGVDLFGNILTNKTNKEAQQAANANNIQLARENNQFNLDMWNRQNEYNSPVNQAKRLMEAGLNPALQNVSTGVATSAPQGTLAQVNPVMQDFSGASNAISKLMSIPMIKQQLRSQELDNKTKEVSNMFQESMILKTLANLDLGIEKGQLENAGLRLLNDFNRNTQDAREGLLREQLLQQTMQNDLLKKQLDFLPQQQEMEVQRFVADISTLAAQRDMTRQQIANLVKQSNQIESITEGLNIDNRQKERMEEAIVQGAYWNASVSKATFFKTKWQAVHERKNSGYDSPYKESQKAHGLSWYRGAKAGRDLLY